LKKIEKNKKSYRRIFFKIEKKEHIKKEGKKKTHMRSFPTLLHCSNKSCFKLTFALRCDLASNQSSQSLATSYILFPNPFLVSN